ncbi:RNA polymerase sigma factor [Humisphaera borealis]|uniref:RNA polymerase sigma factor n=1 Tax=Humisphaera borealis TaxID=2807512 RepID=A0A7M2X032_9BACT|nr:RNA polymerase sigma factor [Humisphaera borealis]QOV90994.1 RNA polymerase sigma factor [Humisphaera borealis]
MRSPRTIEAARGGDKLALTTLLRGLQDPWYRFCLGLLRDPDLATDAVQETGLRFLKQISGFRGDSQLRTWSLGIAINVVREMKRRRQRHASGSSEATTDLAETVGDPAPSVGTSAEFVETREVLRQTLADLPDRQREAVVLRFFEDLSVEETASLMGCAAGTVKATVHQALRSLRKRLSPLA